MFYYQDTGKLSEPRELQRKVITEVRQVTYVNNNPDPKANEPLTTTGFEPVKEMVVSSSYVVVPKVVGSKTVDNRSEETPSKYKKSYERN